MKSDVITINKLKKLGFYEATEDDITRRNLRFDYNNGRKCLLYHLNDNDSSFIRFIYHSSIESDDSDLSTKYTHLNLNGSDEYHSWTNIEIYEPKTMTEVKSVIWFWNTISTNRMKKI